MSPLFISKGGGHMIDLQDLINLGILIVNIIAISVMLSKN